MTRNKEQKFIEKARAQFRQDCEQERDIRAEATIDIQFRAGDQWDSNLKRAREDDGRPALTFDKTHVFIQSVANEARQNKPQPKVNPIGGGASTDVANVITGILRHIQYRSKADIAYDTALDYSCGSSFGFLRATTEYANAKSFDQEIKVLTVFDPFSVYGVLIPACLGQDCRHAFVVETISKAEYKARYGDGDEDATPTDWESSEWKAAGDWLAGEHVRIAEYWWVKTKRKTLRHVANPDGSTTPVYTDDKHYNDAANFVMEAPDEDDADGEQVPKERVVEIPCVYSCTMDGTRVIPGTKTEWVGDSIPIVAVLGQQLIVEGVVHLFSLIRFIRDAQKLINIYESGIAEKIALGNRVPYIGYKGQFTDPKWRDANKKNYAYLEVEATTVNGQPAPIPQRQQVEEQISALSGALSREIDNLKAGMGIYDASLGAQGNETSGRGINARQQQSNVTNFHFADNLNRAEWDLCAKLLKVIPKIYDRPGRQVRIVGEDQQHSVVVVNQPHIDEETGKPHHYALDVGEYDVMVTVGPSYTTARAEGADTLMQFFQAAPAAQPLLGDLWVGSLDYPWAREGARRLKAAAPQNIVNEDGGAAAQQVPPAVQQQIEQGTQLIQHLQQQLQILQGEAQSKKAELDSRERIAAMQEQTKRTLGLATLNQSEGIALLENELDVAHRVNAARQDATGAMNDHAHQQAMAQQAQRHAAGMQQGAQQHEQIMTAQQQQATAAQQQAAAQQQPQNPQARQEYLAG